jgi:lycopene cyclase domain-containing protein
MRTLALPRAGVLAAVGFFAALAVIFAAADLHRHGLPVRGRGAGGAGVRVPATLRSRNFWVAIGLTYLPFLAANGILTGLPVVWYDDARILGVRAGSIPLEDFFYSFSMLALAVGVYDVAGRWRSAR